MEADKVREFVETAQGYGLSLHDVSMLLLAAVECAGSQVQRLAYRLQEMDQGEDLDQEM